VLNSKRLIPFLAIVLIIVGNFIGSMVPHTYAAVYRKVLDVPVRTQEQTNWCHAAVAQSVIKYFRNEDVSQCYIVNSIYPSCPNWPAYISAVGTTLRSIRYNIANDHITSSVAFYNVQYQIDNNRPMIVLWQWLNQSVGHMVVLRGYYQDTYRNTMSVSYMDPAIGAYSSASYAAFVNDGIHEWRETLWNIRPQ
jgi:hypothetical protein